MMRSEDDDYTDMQQIGSSKQVSDEYEFERATKKMMSNIKSMEDQMRFMKECYISLLQEHKKLQSEYSADKEKWKRFRDWWQEKMENKRQKPQSSSTFTPSDKNKDRSSDIKQEDRSPEKIMPKDSEISTVDLGASSSNTQTRNLDRTSTEGKITESEAKILRDVGLPLRSHFRTRSMMDNLPTPSRPNSFLDSSSPSNDRLKRSEKASKRSRLSEGSTIKSPAYNDINHRTPLQDRTNSMPQSASSSSVLTKNVSAEKDSKAKTINQEFEINPEMNGNVSYLHKDVVRSKVKRKQMHAHDCECCRDYYDAVGPVAVRPFEDVKKSEVYHDENDDEYHNFSRQQKGTKEFSKVNDSARKRQEHLQRTSRHRDYGPPPSTPQNFWEIGFPDTQKVAEINRSADVADRKRREQMENDPRFRRREL